MKKVLITTLIAVMCFAMAACGAGDSGAGDSANGSGAAESQESADAVDSGENGSQDEDNGEAEAFGSFTSSDLDGNEVTDAIFAEKDVTILNVWGTFCGPCQEEMPELSTLAEELPENAQIIGMLVDVPEGDGEMTETAREICADTNVEYTNIVTSDSVEALLYSIEAVPTTFILDSSGKPVCEPIVGADVESYREAALSYLEEIE